MILRQYEVARKFDEFTYRYLCLPIAQETLDQIFAAEKNPRQLQSGQSVVVATDDAIYKLVLSPTVEYEYKRTILRLLHSLEGSIPSSLCLPAGDNLTIKTYSEHVFFFRI